MITDEMVEKAAKAIIERYTKVSDAPLHTESRMRLAMPDARAALEAVAPALMKQGALIVCDLYEARCRIGKAEPWSENFSHMYARAQELDPQPKSKGFPYGNHDGDW